MIDPSYTSNVRMTKRGEGGELSVVGMTMENKDEKLLECVLKLEQYEATGLSPWEVKRLLWFAMESGYIPPGASV